jgi:beta-lactamase class A
VKQGHIRRREFTVLVLIFLVLCPLAEGMAVPGLPVIVPQSQWQPLERWQDPELQANLARTLKQRSLWQCLISEHKMAVGLVDLSNPKAPRFAQVNGNTMLSAASIPKLAVLLAAFQGFEDRTLPQTPQITLDLHDMIRESSNSATANLIARLGLSKIESLLLNPPYRFYDPNQGGGIWLGTTFASYGERRGDPLKDLYLAATANQVCRFYYLLAYGKLINSKRSIQMMQVLSNPELHDKFVAVLERSMSTYRIFRKNGTYRTTHGDSVLVWGEGWRRYILVGLVEDGQGEQILRDLVPVAERVLRQTQGRSGATLGYNNME